MPNWDRQCQECEYTGSYLDFHPVTMSYQGTKGTRLAFIEEQTCRQPLDGGVCRGAVEYREDEE